MSNNRKHQVNQTFHLCLNYYSNNFYSTSPFQNATLANKTIILAPDIFRNSFTQQIFLFSQNMNKSNKIDQNCQIFVKQI